MLKNQLPLQVALFYDAVRLYLASWFRIRGIAFFTQRFYGSLGHIKTSFTFPMSGPQLPAQDPVVCCQSDDFWAISVACLKCRQLYLHLQEMNASAPLASVLTLWSHKTCSTFSSQWPINRILWETVFLRLFLGGGRQILTFSSQFFKPLELKQTFFRSYERVGACISVGTEWQMQIGQPPLNLLPCIEWNSLTGRSKLDREGNFIVVKQPTFLTYFHAAVMMNARLEEAQ